MNTDIGNQTWYTMYEKCKKLKDDNENVITSMIWGSLWDETLSWLVESKAIISDGKDLTYYLVGEDSTNWGNYLNATFKYITEDSQTPKETSLKEAGSTTKIPTGSSNYTKANNIFDLAGNVRAWTLESNGDGDGRMLRSGDFEDRGAYYSADYRSSISNSNHTPTGENGYGCRSLLLIK